MALKISLSSSDIGIPIPDTYARIVMWRGDKEQTLIQVVHYVSEEARRLNSQSVANKTFFVPTSQVGNMESMYNWLKTLPEYENAEDC